MKNNIGERSHSSFMRAIVLPQVRVQNLPRPMIELLSKPKERDLPKLCQVG